jgi:tRNA pseudouridine13 synthase
MPFAFGGPQGEGQARLTPEDFQVDEILGFEPDGEGEHLLLQIRKRETNTQWLARQLASFAGVPPRDVSYAGLKDRHAVTTQWYSIRLAGRAEADWRRLESDQIEILRVERHRRKLRPGALKGNRFLLVIRALSGRPEKLEEQLGQIRELGMPNYFGEQRFGQDYGNLQQAERLFSGKAGAIDRKLRGLLISSVRSQLFNEVLAARIETDCWDCPIPGDYMKLDGSRSGFAIEQADGEILRRCQEMDIHPSGPLWGKGELKSGLKAGRLELAVLDTFSGWRSGLEKLNLEQDRRPLRVPVRRLKWDFLSEQELQLEFDLPAGSYATVLLREIILAKTEERAK